MPVDLRFREFNALKIWHHADRLKSLAAGLDVAPITVEVDLVAFCNHHCFWCVDPYHFPMAASRDFLCQLLDDLASFRVNGYSIQGLVFKGGGEQTLHPDFCELLEKAHALGFEIGVVTNGSRLLQADLAEALNRWASYVRISIDGPTQETHHRIHCTYDFYEIISGIEKLISLRQGRHPIVGLSFAMDHAMLAWIPEAINLGDRIGVDYVLIRPPFFEEVGCKSTMSPAQAAELRQALLAATKAYPGPMDVFIGNWVGDAEAEQDDHVDAGTAPSGRRDHHLRSDHPIEHRLGKCWASPLLAVISADGQVYGCCNLRFLKEWSFGQLDYERSITLATIWNGEQRHRISERMGMTQCIAHCTHPMTRYNEIIEVLRDKDKFHSGFV